MTEKLKIGTKITVKDGGNDFVIFRFHLTLFKYEVVKKIENAHEDSIWSVAWKKDKIISGSVDNTVKIWFYNFDYNFAY